MKIKLNNNPNEIFRIIINEEVYFFEQLWSANGWWLLNIYDANKHTIINGIKIVPNIDLLQQFAYLNFSLIYISSKPITRNNLNDSYLVIK